MSHRNLLAIIATVMTCSPAASEECKPPPEQLTILLADYIDCLVSNFGADATVTVGTLIGTTKDKKSIDFQFPTPTAASEEARFVSFISTFYLYPAIPLCSPSAILAEKTSGAYVHRWCADSSVAPYEAKRDKWYLQGGRITPLGSNRFDCGIVTDVSLMPPSVQVAVCYP
jgi:hypothetical protein